MKGSSKHNYFNAFKAAIACALAAVMVICMMPSVTFAESSTTYHINYTYDQTAARSMLSMINAFRTGSEAWYWNSSNTQKVQAQGLKELVYDYELEKVAMQRAAEIAIYFDHTRPDGTDCFSAVGEIGYSWNALGENIAYGWGSFNTAAEVMEAWKETNESYSGQGHRRNMLSGNFNRVAVGFAKYNGRNYWVQEFSYSTSPVSETTAVNGVKNVGVKVADSLAQRLNLKDEEAPSQPEDPTPSQPEEPTPSEPETPGTIYVPDENGNINYGRTVGALNNTIDWEIYSVPNEIYGTSDWVIGFEGTGPMPEYKNNIYVQCEWDEYAAWIALSKMGRYARQIRIEEGITSVGRYNFNGMLNEVSVYLPESVVMISSKAFTNMSHLAAIYIPNPDTVIAADAIDDQSKRELTIYGPSGSNAQSYAAANGIRYVVYPESDEPVDPEPSQPEEPAPGETDFPVVTIHYISLGGIIVGMKTGTSTQLEAEADLDLPFTWTSSNEEVATVDENGVLTAHRYGTSDITVSNGVTELTSTLHTRFYDVAGSNDKEKSNYQYYYDPVYWAADNGITQGYDGVYFGPQLNCQRRELMIFLWRLAGEPQSRLDPHSSFNDMGAYSSSSATYKAVAWGVENGITKGYADGGFHPESAITRKDVLIMLYRLAGKPSVYGSSKFSDVDFASSSDTFKAILWGTQLGITKGYADGTFRPYANCLREHIVTFLYRYDQKVN